MKPMGGGLLENAIIAFKYLRRFPDTIPIVGIEEEHLTLFHAQKEGHGFA